MTYIQQTPFISKFTIYVLGEEKKYQNLYKRIERLSYGLRLTIFINNFLQNFNVGKKKVRRKREKIRH